MELCGNIVLGSMDFYAGGQPSIYTSHLVDMHLRYGDMAEIEGQLFLTVL